jgi:hypothetical protein
MIAVLSAAVAIFATGFAAGIITLVSVISRRDDRQKSLRKQARDRLAKAARLLTGPYVSHPSPPDAARPDAHVPQR